MEINRCIKESFSIIGKEGSTRDGEGFIKRLWKDANACFGEISALAKRDENGNVLGIWGAMSGFDRDFSPWEDNFTKGLYLAGVESADGAEAPEGFVKWTLPSAEYLYVKAESPLTFAQVNEYMRENGIALAGAVHDYFCPEEKGQAYLFFPVRWL